MIGSPVIGFTGAFLLMLGIYWIFRNAKRKPMARRFRRLQVVSAGYMAFSRSNDAEERWASSRSRCSRPARSRRSRCRSGVIVVSATAISLGTAVGAGGSWRRWAIAWSSSSRSHVRRGDDRRHGHHRGRAVRGAGVDDPRHLQRHHGRWLGAWAKRRPLGRRPAHPPRLDHHHPGRRPCRRGAPGAILHVIGFG